MNARCIVLSTVVIVVSTLALCVANPAAAATQTWSNLGTDWGTASNWFGALPGPTDAALFNLGAYSAQPNVGETSSVGGLWSTGSGPLTIGGTSPLTINGTTINGNANTGIEMNPGAGAMTVKRPVTLGGAQQWFNNSGSTLNIAAPVTAAYGLSLTGSGATFVNSPISGSGGLTVGLSANVVMTAASNYSGTTTINGGMLTLQPSTVAPTLAAANAPAPLVWFDPSNPTGYALTGGSVTTMINLSPSGAAENATVQSSYIDASNLGAPP